MVSLYAQDTQKNVVTVKALYAAINNDDNSIFNADLVTNIKEQNT